MRNARAIFTKQVLDLLKNYMVLIQYIIFPLVALVFTELVAKADDTIPDSLFVTMFAGIFSGMTLVSTTVSIIAEDRERKSLRFLIMAGVRPSEYLLGIGGVVLCASLVVSVAFALMGAFAGREFVVFVSVMVLASVASILLGATIGILSKNQQAATAVGMPIAMILGFGPMIAMFNETAGKVFGIFYTQQMSVITSDFSASLTKPLLIILANIAVLLVLFMVAYKKKGLR